jgi:hypothetical protein
MKVPTLPSYYGSQEAVRLFSLKNKRDHFEQGVKWDAPLDLDFGLGLWRLHTMAVQVEKPWEFIAKGLDFEADL